jgi:hypothetical protein
LGVDGGDVSHVPDASVVVLLEFALVGLDLLAELAAFGFDADDSGFDAFLAHLFAAAFG